MTTTTFEGMNALMLQLPERVPHVDVTILNRLCEKLLAQATRFDRKTSQQYKAALVTCFSRCLDKASLLIAHPEKQSLFRTVLFNNLSATDISRLAINAINERDAESFRRLIALEEFDPNILIDDETVLMAAAKHGLFGVIATLLKRKDINITLSNSKDETALTIAQDKAVLYG